MADGLSHNRKCALSTVAAQVSGSNTDFPVLFTAANLPPEMFDADGAHPAQNGGGDIRFSSDSAGAALLACELVSFVTDPDPANGAAEIWVKLPNVRQAQADTIYVWYDTPSSDSQPAVTAASGRNAVWSDYYAVHHFAETSGDWVDSSGNGIVVPRGSSGRTSGPFAYAADVSAADIIYSGSGLPAGNLDHSLSCWLKQPTRAANKNVLHTKWSGGNHFRRLFVGPAANGYPVRAWKRAGSGATEFVDGAGYNIDADNSWYLLHAAFDGTRLEAFCGGQTDGASTITAYDPSNPDQYLVGGGGYVAQARIYKTAPTTAWVATEQANHTDPGGFISVGTPESVGGSVSLAIANAVHAHTSDVAVLSVGLSLAIADAVHNQTTDSVLLGQLQDLVAAGCAHAHSARQVALAQLHFLLAASAGHAETADSVRILLASSGAPADRTLAVADETGVLGIAADPHSRAVGAAAGTLSITSSR